MLFGGDVIFVTIDRVVVFGDERGDEERFGFRFFGARRRQRQSSVLESSLLEETRRVCGIQSRSQKEARNI